MTKVKHLKRCRVCNGKNLTKIVKLSKMPFTDEFMTFKNIGKEFLHDINVFLCKDCQVVQTQHDVEVNKYYLDYQYSVAHSKIANKFINSLFLLCKICSPSNKLLNNHSVLVIVPVN